MRTISAADEALFTAVGGRSTFLRVDVKDSGGTFRDLTTYPGENMVLGGTWGETVDSPSLSGTVRLKRAVELLNLAPLMDTSPLNMAFNPAATPAPLLAPGREVDIYTAVVPDGSRPSSGDWKLKLHGRIDRVKGGGEEEITLEVSDLLQGDCRDAFIERERVYAHASPADADATKGLYVYEVGRTYAVGDLILPTEAKRNGHFYAISAISTGIAGAEGTYPTSAGGTAVFGGVTVQEKGATTTSVGTDLEVVLQQLATDNATGVTITTPVSPAWLLKWYLQQRVHSWEAMVQLVDQIGWELRSRWDSGTSTFKMKLLTIDRAKSSPDRTFSASEKLEVTQLDIGREDVRNVVRVVYSDPADLDPEGNAKRKAIERTNATSITAFGRRFMELAEASSSQIDTLAEAQAMADAALADLASPTAEKATTLDYFPFVELGDLYRFSGDGVHHSGDLDLAVTGYTHTISETDATTELQLRGKPSGGAERWLAKAAEVNPDDSHQLILANAAGVTLSTLKVVGGVKLIAGQALGKRALPVGFQFHVSDTPGFTPSGSSLVRSGLDNEMNWGAGYGGGTYYGQVIPFGWNAQRKVLAGASDEVSFVAGFVEPHHLNPEAFRGELPPNGSFEGQFRASGPPDRYEMVVGTWGTDITSGQAKSVDPADGSRYLLFGTTSVATEIRSDYFPVPSDHVFELLTHVYRVSGDGDYELEVEWYTGNKVSVSASTLTVDLGALTTSAWNLVRTMFAVPATAAFGRFVIRKASAHADPAYFDGCQLLDRGEKWVDLDDAAFTNSWGNGKGGVAVGFRAEAGRGWMMGSMGSGTLNQDAFPLPERLYPSHEVQVPVATDTGHGRLRITTGGLVRLLAGGTGEVWLDSVSWPLS